MNLRKTEEALALLATFIEASGPCEHAVSICVCGEKQVHADALAEVEALKRAALDVVVIVREGGARVPDADWAKDMVVLSNIAKESTK